MVSLTFKISRTQGHPDSDWRVVETCRYDIVGPQIHPFDPAVTSTSSSLSCETYLRVRRRKLDREASPTVRFLLLQAARIRDVQIQICQ